MPDLDAPAARPRERPIAAEFPEIARSVPWTPLADAPTAVEPASAIAAAIGHGGVFHKRDDKVAALYGGNKVRRFEYLLADAKDRGARRLVTAGGLASTQVMATVLFGRAAGFAVSAALFDQPVTAFAKEAIRTGVRGGGDLIYGGGYASTALGVIGALRGADRPYLILPGASTPTALFGYVDAMLELGEQVRRGEAPRPDVIVVPAGSGGTLAGLAVGASILRWPTRIVGVRITELFACNRATVRALIEATIRALKKYTGKLSALPAPRFAIHHGAIGRGYGHPTPEAIAAIPEVERLIGVPGEVTYSGKGIAGLRAVARRYPGATILYWHTLSSALPPPGGGAEGAVPEAFAKVMAQDPVC